MAELRSRHIVLATGARARVLPPLEPDGRLVWSYKEALVPQAMPKSLLVVGSGAIGIEFASFYSALGADVTVIEMLDRVLPAEDEEISEFARKAFTRRGLRIITGATVTGLAKAEDAVTVTFVAGGQPSTLRVERVLSSGRDRRQRRGARTRTHPGPGRADAHRRRRVVAARRNPASTPSATWPARPGWRTRPVAKAILCVERIAGAGHPQPLDRRRIPGCTYSQPQVASVGLTEREARETGCELRDRAFPLPCERQGDRPG